MLRDLSIQRLTDICIAINAVDGTDVAPEYCNQNKRVRNSLYSLMIREASDLYVLKNVSLKRLTNAIHKAGWGENTFVLDENGITLI